MSHYDFHNKLELYKWKLWLCFSSYFSFLLLSVWEECRSLPHSRLHSTDDFQIQSTESNTTATSMRKQVSNKNFSYLLKTPTCTLHRMGNYIMSGTYDLVQTISNENMLLLK